MAIRHHSNCGQFFSTGSNGENIATVGALAQALSNVNSGQVAILTSIGNYGLGCTVGHASDNATPNSTIPLAAALQSYGIPDKSILYLEQPFVVFRISSPLNPLRKKCSFDGGSVREVGLAQDVSDEQLAKTTGERPSVNLAACTWPITTQAFSDPCVP
jgi:hypothetical protein